MPRGATPAALILERVTNMVHTRDILGGVLLAALAAACGRLSEEMKSRPPASAPSEKKACDLVTQEEVDGIFEAPVGAGTDEMLGDGSLLCSWPAGNQPKLVLKVSTVVPEVNRAVDLGGGYRVAFLADMGGPAAMAVAPGEPGQEETVALLALNAGNWTLTINPFQLRVKTGTERFERLKVLLQYAAERL